MIEFLLSAELSCSQANDIISRIKQQRENMGNQVVKELIHEVKTMYRSVLMKDQYSISDDESKQDKWNRGLDLFIESVLKPDPALRQCAHNQRCYHGYGCEI